MCTVLIKYPIARSCRECGIIMSVFCIYIFHYRCKCYDCWTTTDIIESVYVIYTTYQRF